MARSGAEMLKIRSFSILPAVYCLAGLFFLFCGEAYCADGGNVAVMRFAGPQIVDVDADEIWKIKNKVAPPTKGELTKLNVLLQEKLIQQLRELVGKKVLLKSELDKTLSASAPDAGAEQNEKLAKALGAKYLVTGTIERVEFDGNTVLKDVYEMVITTKLVDADSGKRIWQQESKKYRVKAFTRKTGGTVYDVFAKTHVPDVAASLASSIASAMGR